jgi:hypothetical protein
MTQAFSAVSLHNSCTTASNNGMSSSSFPGLEKRAISINIKASGSEMLITPATWSKILEANVEPARPVE